MNILAAKKNRDTGPDNPYLSSRKQWNSYAREITTSRTYWQIAAVLCLLLALAALGGIIHIGQQSKYIPYVVEVDKLGQHATSQILSPTVTVDSRVLKTAVINFIHDARVVTPDVALQRKAIDDVYYHLQNNQPATTKMNELYSQPDTNPFERAATLMVSTQIESVLQQSQETWQVDWVETVRDRQGVVQGEPVKMRALVSVYVAELASGASPEQVQNNPLGIYIRDFSWSQQL